MPQINNANQSLITMFPMSSERTQNRSQCSTTKNWMPANLIYPETNKRLACNYFGSNDYRRKRTINDLRETVIEERSPQKQLLKKKKYASISPDCGALQNREANYLTDSPMEKDSVYNKTATFFIPKQLELQQDEFRRFETSVRPDNEDSSVGVITEAEKAAEALAEVLIRTPEDFKGV